VKPRCGAHCDGGACLLSIKLRCGQKACHFFVRQQPYGYPRCNRRQVA
jgi:hypothetical protein